MTEAEMWELADRLFEAVRRERDRQLIAFVKDATGEAAGKGRLGAGFFHKELADRHADELRQRGESLLRVVKQVLSNEGAVDATRAKAFVDRTIRRDADELTRRLGELLKRHGGVSSWLAAEVTDEVPKVIDNLGAELDLFLLQKASPRSGDQEKPTGAMPDARRVFVVHGRDALLTSDMFAFLSAIGLLPIEWKEAVKLTGKGSPYIGEVLDAAFHTAQAVVVILSPDDEVRLSPDLLRDDDDAQEREERLQSRPNVLFEAGMAFGFQRDRTILVEVGSPKPFSDVAGRHTVRLTNADERREDLMERLRTAGCRVQTASDAWRSVGNFEPTRGGRPRPNPPKSEPTVKFVDMNYPHDSGLQGRLEADGFRVRWCEESSIARRLDIEGWTLATVTGPDGREIILKMKDRPEDQTLLKKRESDLKA